MATEEDNDARSAFIMNFFSDVLKGNPAVAMSLLVGVFEIRGGSILSCLNNLEVRTIADDPFFNDCFGFTKIEVKACLRLQKKLKLWPQVRNYYNGYCIDGCKVINPWSFMKFLRKFRMRPYWVGTNQSEALFDSLKKNGVSDSEIFKTIEVLFKRGEPHYGRMKVEALDPIQRVDHGGPMERDRFLHFMCMTGYLTYKSLEGDDDSAEDDEDVDLGEDDSSDVESGEDDVDIASRQDDDDSDEEEEALVWIPNKEVRRAWETLVARMNNCNSMKDLRKSYPSLMKDLVEFNQNKIKEFFEKVVKTVSSRATYETSFQHCFGGVFLGLQLEYKACESLCETGAGDGFCDQIIKFPVEKRAMIVEYKITKDQTKSEKLAQEALDQIFHKRYYLAVERDSAILLIGCAIWKKSSGVAGVTVKFEELTKETRDERIKTYQDRGNAEEETTQSSTKKQRKD